MKFCLILKNRRGGGGEKYLEEKGIYEKFHQCSKQYGLRVHWKFTWDNRSHGQSLIKERLDRVISNKEWLLHFQEAKVEHLWMEESDHAPILLRTVIERKTWRRPFRFLSAWTTESTSFDVVQRAWQLRVGGGMESHIIMRKLNSTTRALKRWNYNHFGIA